MSQMLKSSGAMAAATLTSRVLGMVREMVYAAFMGNKWVASAFVLAFQVPNLFRRLLGRRRADRRLHPHLQTEGSQRGRNRNVALLPTRSSPG
jgi:putative peptidoglycan lipid II flippase